MPFSNRYKIIFVHIPKTGGTSIENFFDMDQNENMCFYSWDIDQFSFIEKHKHFTDSKKIVYEPQHYSADLLKQLISNYDDYFKFTFVRNPYTRILSEYYWFKKNQELKTTIIFNPEDFHEWCEEFLFQINSSHKEPQVSFIDNSIDFIGKFENIQNDFNSLIEKLKLKQEYLNPNNTLLPVLNSIGQNKEQLVPRILEKTKKLIFNIYKADFIQFNYDNQL
jgi:hypothetical protein